VSRRASRLVAAFDTPGKKLVVYVTCGHPSIDASVEIIVAAARAGADVIELGVPFSDPSADGPAIQRAMTAALAAGAGPRAALDVTRRVRAAGCDVPIVLFGYYNPIFVSGVAGYCGAAADAGADALLVVDLPIEESGELVPLARAAGLDVVPLLAPTSSPARMRLAAASGAPFVYYVSLTGVTGAALESSAAGLAARVAEVRAAVGCPVAVGFGIATPAQARDVARVADGIVVGTAIVKAIDAAPADPAGAVAALVASLKSAIS